MEVAQNWAQVTVGEAVLQYGLMIVGSVANLYLAGCVFFLLERIRPAVPGQKFFKTDFKNEALYPIINAAVSTPVFTLLSVVLTAHLLEPYMPYHLFGGIVGEQHLVVQVLFVMLVADVGVWLEHWFAHKVLWDYHALHHVTREVNWLTHARVHPVNGITIALASLFVHFAFGLDGEATAIATFVVLATAMWEHANIDFAWPWPLNYLFVSPRFHRWHHSSAPEAVDKNLCLVFPFIDLAMGTYYCPDRLPEAYGVCRFGPEDPVIPDSFRGQMAYPFRRTAARWRAWLTRRRRPAPAPTPGDVGSSAA
mgnify:CR=1 FL=1